MTRALGVLPEATYTRLTDGTWGLRGLHLKRGDRVAVQTRAGAVRVERVHSVVSVDADGVTVARKEYSGPNSGSWK